MLPEVKQQIRSLLTLLFLGIASACLVATYFVYFYGSSGRYSTQSTLLAPNVIEQLNYNDFNPKTSSADRYIFKKIEFEYYLPEDGKWYTKQIDIPTYNKLYQLIGGDQSIADTGAEIESLFNQKSARFILTVTTESNAQWQNDTKVFQEVQFPLVGDLYRVQLHENNSGTQWAYFSHPKIYNKMLEILTSKNP